MKLEISTWAEVIGIVTLVLSLVFVGMELRHSTATSSAQALLDLNAAVNGVMMAQAEDPQLAEIILRGDQGLGGLSEVEKHRFENLLATAFNFHENAFMFYKLGVLDQDEYEGYAESVCRELSFPGRLEFWKEGGYVFQADFSSFIRSRCNLPG